MKIKYTFEKMELDGDIMAVPVGDGAKDFSAMLRLNETAADILDFLIEETTEEEIVNELLKIYEGDRDEIAAYVHEYIGTLIEAGIIE